MTNVTTARFLHRPKSDGTVDSICLACLGTITAQSSNVSLEREEEDHVCLYAFPARRSGRLPVGMERGRRRSDAEWGTHQPMAQQA